VPTNTPATPSKSDGIYNPTTFRLPYQLISTDWQEIVALTNQVNEGKPLPAADILTIYEKGKNTTSPRFMRTFARDPARTRDFPDEVAFYCSHTWLDDPVIDAINGTGTAARYTAAQRRQAIQKGTANILYHWSRHYIQRGVNELNNGLVDEAWAIYVGEEKDGKYPNSLRTTAESREANYNRQGQLDVPLRTAMEKLRVAALNKNKDAAQ
jgi:hypothetical protein